MIYRNRLHFAAILRRAIAEGTLTSYERDGLDRTAVLADGSIHRYELMPMPCDERERGDDDGRTYSDPRDARAERL